MTNQPLIVLNYDLLGQSAGTSNVGGVALLGMTSALVLGKWLPLLIGALAILAMFVRPRGKLFIEANPPPAGWPRL
jgi:hypothetical protein